LDRFATGARRKQFVDLPTYSTVAGREQVGFPAKRNVERSMTTLT
jgi:hypothetical protein